ncbi:VOC family protein [Sporolactobacillus sp. THM19-2]|uniref:VOC family protein n=1 Tax=Sporolactobacillus sp. THM19-2 TaxID=2511171 RepID=UPI00101EE73E|nr:VOC family protein [Sporolactobacillus sp. THM19-2]RYL92389.1 VOC family protein [Sporolactobacillus sp. THM19-2]
MIKGLYEAHLPVSNLEQSIDFYQKLGLKLYKRYNKVAFFWIEEGKSWIGLWEGKESELPYHVSIKHIAFYVDIEDIKKAPAWLRERGIKVRDAFGMGTREPVVIPDQAHAMIYFDDPDGNHLEFITRLPKEMNRSEKMYLSEWEKLL